jgi:ribosome biogenesis protein MAK21
MHANIKMLVATQRSKTNANKVHAFSMLIRDNIVANSMSLNAFLDNF